MLFGCASNGIAIDKTETVSSSYTLRGFGTLGALSASIAARSFRHNDRVAVCAAIGENRGQLLASETVEYLKTGAAFHLGDQKIMAGAAFAPVYDDPRALVGRLAKCAVTETVWQEAFASQKVRVTVKPGVIKN